ncbi:MULTISPECIES: hypothetical protein [Rhodopseudomonas]|uniref:hypothetical protein n=1 Tax=Rhodopseudomonas TaxID=1073 RepID=UPI00128D2994|nr:MULTISPECIES: hypothetical protein [Rhodopseudomonas]MDF3812566.1 hypothetical protein [Rhodopseudomonas sp. BAL398]WOK17885.1 hypothetical protein RBJ75_27885 [Rhodopseudomonas sp. BAL398]
MANRQGQAAAGVVTLAGATAERRVSEKMLKANSKPAGRRITCTKTRPTTRRSCGPSAWQRRHPQVAQHDAATSTGRRNAIDARTSRHQGTSMSQSRRAMIACSFGWSTQHGTMRKTEHCGLAHVAATSCSG